MRSEFSSVWILCFEVTPHLVGLHFAPASEGHFFLICPHIPCRSVRTCVSVGRLCEVDGALFELGCVLSLNANSEECPFVDVYIRLWLLLCLFVMSLACRTFPQKGDEFFSQV